MKKGIAYADRTQSLSLTALATLCFVTLALCQIRFRITKELSPGDTYPPVLRSKDCWFLYSIGSPDRFKCVPRAFIVISSPILSLVSTGLLLLGKIESNPYFFMPWLFLTLKGLLLVQTDNLITILRDMSSRSNFAFGFRLEDFKWLLFYFTVFSVDLLEALSFYEIFDVFMVLWNHHPGYDLESMNLGATKKDIVDIMETISKCSLGSLSKLSLGSLTDTDETHDETDEIKGGGKLSFKADRTLLTTNSPTCLSKGEPVTRFLRASTIPEEFETSFESSVARKMPPGDLGELPSSDATKVKSKTGNDLEIVGVNAKNLSQAELGVENRE